MSQNDRSDPSLNPALKQTEEKHHGTETTPAPIDSVSAHEGQNESWPIAWFVVAILCVCITIYLFL
ncbi:hypothetical protein ACFSUK_13025 [Sphingobium scionense]|jgi:hypothetical protein|uniref:Uncharacterized protein n=1 Tax=Sphingobium scionense TaxID=1404341 RepID=A0A7W6LUQ3_9SPHN|nr:hypothetical protein [Sphingobium scionense]MBB4149726.1 hypothetical protein [Sphingobium scionense]